MASSIVKILIEADNTGTIRAMSEVEAKAEKSQGAFGKMAQAGKAAFLGLAVGAAALGVETIKLAEDDQAAQAKLSTALKNNGQSWDDNKEAIERANKAGEHFGYTAADTMEVLSKFVTQGQGVSEATKSIGVAQEVAAGTGKDLASVSDMLMKAHEGNYRGLKSLGIATTDQIKGFKSYGEVLDFIGQKYKGQAAAAADTFQGKTKALMATLKDTGAEIGAKLIPIVLQLATAIAAIVGWFEKHKTVAMALGVAIGIVTGVLIACYIAQKVMAATTVVVQAATKAWTAAQWLLNVALDANPIGLVVIAIAALVAGIVIAYKHVGVIHDAIDGFWQLLQKGYHWVMDNWPLIAAILTGPIGIAVLFITDHWDQVKEAFDKVWNGIKDIAGNVAQWFKDGVKDIENIITAPFKAAFNAIANIWNSTIGKIHFQLPSWIPILGGDSFDMPQIPTFHSGGIFNSLSGEGFARLKDGEGVFTPEQMRALGDGRAQSSPQGHQTINFPAGHAPTAVNLALTRHNRRNGKG